MRYKLGPRAFVFDEFNLEVQPFGVWDFGESIYLPRSGCASKPRVAVSNPECASQSSTTATRLRPMGATRTGLIISNRCSPGLKQRYHPTRAARAGTPVLGSETLPLGGIDIPPVALVS